MSCVSGHQLCHPERSLDPHRLPPLTHNVFRELSIKPGLPSIFKSSYRETSEEGFLRVTRCFYNRSVSLLSFVLVLYWYTVIVHGGMFHKDIFNCVSRTWTVLTLCTPSSLLTRAFPQSHFCFLRCMYNILWYI